MPPHGLDAKQQFRYFVRKGYRIPKQKVYRHGDLLYNNQGKYGHVMIVISNTTVAENSIVHGDKWHEGRGTRLIKNVRIDGAIRLPQLHTNPRM